MDLHTIERNDEVPIVGRESGVTYNVMRKSSMPLGTNNRPSWNSAKSAKDEREQRLKTNCPFDFLEPWEARQTVHAFTKYTRADAAITTNERSRVMQPRPPRTYHSR